MLLCRVPHTLKAEEHDPTIQGQNWKLRMREVNLTLPIWQSSMQQSSAASCVLLAKSNSFRLVMPNAFAEVFTENHALE